MLQPYVIPIVGMLIPIVIVPTILAFKHARFLREIEHAEKMRAMELGISMEDPQHCWSMRSLAALIGGGVPLGALFLAYIANSHSQNADVWGMASSVGITGLICGSILAARASKSESCSNQTNTKPVFDPESFESVSRR